MTSTTELTTRREEAETELHRIAEELSRAQQDTELLTRLKSAAERVKRLEPQFAAASDAVAKAKAAETAAKNAARFAGLRDINVRELPGAVSEYDQTVTRASFEITYTQDRYDFEAQESVPAPVTVTGFDALPDTVFDYLVEKHPAKVPNKIMALAPGDPRGAFNNYFRDLRRGYTVQ